MLPVFVREGARRAAADQQHAGRRPAHPGLAAEGRRRGGRARARRGDAVRRPRRPRTPPAPARSTPTASSTSRSPTCVAEVGDALPVMATCASTSSPTTATAACSTAAGRGRQRRHPRGVRRDGARPGRRRRRRGRAQRDDGRPGAGDPRGPRRRRRTRTSRSWPTPRSTPPRSTARSARPSTPRWSGDRRTYQQDAANALEGVREALLDVAEGADIVMVKPALAYLDVRPRGARRRRRARSRRTTSPGSTPWSRRPPRTAGSTARPRSWRRSRSIRRAGADVDPDLLGRRGRHAPRLT